MKPYDLGLICGRFQHIHIGHEFLINTCFKLCDRILIFVGSAQESNTKRNPFDVPTRIELIETIFDEEKLNGKIIVKPLPDMTPEDPESHITPEWGRYVLNNVKFYTDKIPDVMVYGNDEARSKWFDRQDIKDMMEIIAPRSRIDVSATKMRQLLLADDKKTWMQFANPKIHGRFFDLRNHLLKIEYDKLKE
jgi:nicotinamide-nucleotide adenylyltransferase